MRQVGGDVFRQVLALLLFGFKHVGVAEERRARAVVVVCPVANAASITEHEVKSSLPLDIVVRKATAVLELPRTVRLGSDVRRIILADGHVVLGNTSVCHVETPHAPERVILSLDGEETGIRCRRKGGVLVDGEDAGDEGRIPLGAHVEAGELTFTITGASPGAAGTTSRRGERP